jgi:hypothetical protein
MRNADVVELFDRVEVGTPVVIARQPLSQALTNRRRKPLHGA